MPYVSCVGESTKSDCHLYNVCLPACLPERLFFNVELFGSQCTDFMIFRTSCSEHQIFNKSGKNIRQFTRRPSAFIKIS
jgi:hypothetical protein